MSSRPPHSARQTPETFEGCLVRGSGAHVGAGIEIIRVHRANHVRPFDQAFGRPQRIAQVGTATFEFRGERAIHNRTAAPPGMDQAGWALRRRVPLR